MTFCGDRKEAWGRVRLFIIILTLVISPLVNAQAADEDTLSRFAPKLESSRRQMGVERILSQATQSGSDQTGPATRVDNSITMSVSNDLAVSIPRALKFVPDEHISFLPAISPGVYNVIVAGANQVGRQLFGDTLVLQTRDFLNFTLAPGFGNPDHGQAIFWAPRTIGSPCNYAGVTHFDEQYAAPGGVVHDPTRGPGNLIMIYEAEIHCPHAPKGAGAGWVSVGVARSADGGRTWPMPVARPGVENDWQEYGNGRYAGVTLPGAPPTAGLDKFYGDSLPSAFVDDMDPSGDYYLYVPYQFTGSPTIKPDAFIHMARAKLGDKSGHRVEGPLQFYKWHVDSNGKGGWTQEGRGGLESAVMTSPCASGAMGEGNAQIVYNDALRLYMMTFTCTKLNCVAGQECTAVNLSWYYSTATRLGAQEWSPPQLMQNSTRPVTMTGHGMGLRDGGYASFMTPGHEPGHIGMTGYALFLQGDPLGPRNMAARTFTVTAR
jgi:hypothetical protein